MNKQDYLMRLFEIYESVRLDGKHKHHGGKHRVHGERNNEYRLALTEKGRARRLTRTANTHS